MAAEPLTSTELLEAAKAEVEGISAEDAAAALEDGETLIVDVREADERARNGMIPGSVPAPRGRLEFIADPASPNHRLEFDPSRRLIIHCQGGRRSVLAAQSLKRMGFAKVTYLEGGFAGWQEAGQPVESASL